MAEEFDGGGVVSPSSYMGGGDDLMSSSSASSRPFEGDGYLGFDPRLPSQRFEAFHIPDRYPDPDFSPLHDTKDSDDDYKASNGYDHLVPEVPPPYDNAFDEEPAGQSPDLSSSFGQAFESNHQHDFAQDTFSPTPESNGKSFSHDGVEGLYTFGQQPSIGSTNGVILPPPEEMQAEEGFALREWKRQNAIRLEEKERKEREKLSQIIDAADAFKDEFSAKRKTHRETSKNNNREKEKVFLANQENFHATADKHYWKAVAELIPNELPTMEVKSRGNKDKKKPTVVVNKGPKPGKTTDLSRMRQVLLRLKHNPPAHMKAPQTTPPAAPVADGSTTTSGTATTPSPPQVQDTSPVVAAA